MCRISVFDGGGCVYVCTNYNGTTTKVIMKHISNYSKNSIWRKKWKREIWIFANNVPIIIESVHSNF